MENKLSVIIPYTYSGDDLREAALTRLMDCIANQEFKDFEIIVVEELNKLPLPPIPDSEWKKMEYDINNPTSRSFHQATWKVLKEKVNYFLDSSDGKFKHKGKIDKYIVLKNNNLFNKSWCINVAVKQASHDNIIIIDADMLFGKEYFQEIMNFKVGKKFFTGYGDIICLPGKDNPVTRVIRNSIKAMGGCWFTDKRFFFEELGGMNESYFGYGGEDNDMWERATAVLGKIPKIQYPVVHQYHHWHMKGSSFPLNPIRLLLLKRTQANPIMAINRLKKMNLGLESGPQEIK